MEQLHHAHPESEFSLQENRRTSVTLEGPGRGNVFLVDLPSRWHLSGVMGLKEAIRAGNGILNTTFLIHGFGCAGVTDSTGCVTSTYFDEVVKQLGKDDPSFRTAFSFDAPGYNMTPKEDKNSIKRLEWYGIQYQPVALLTMLMRWAKDIRAANIHGLREINVGLVGHSMGGRALAELYGMQYEGEEGNVSPLMELYLSKLAQVAEVEKINAVPIFVAPAFEFHPQAKRLFDALKPLRYTDSYVRSLMKSLPGSADHINRIYRLATGRPYEQISAGILSGKDRFSLVDNTGFLKGFSRNNPHILLHQATQLEKPSKTIPQKIDKNLQERGIPYLVITNGDDRIVSNQAIFDLFGDPTGEFEPDDMDNLFHSSFQTGVVTLQNVGHTEMLHVPHSIATLVHHRMASI